MITHESKHAGWWHFFYYLNTIVQIMHNPVFLSLQNIVISLPIPSDKRTQKYRNVYFRFITSILKVITKDFKTGNFKTTKLIILTILCKKSSKFVLILFIITVSYKFIITSLATKRVLK